MWNPSEFNSASSSSYINSDYSFTSFTEEGSESSSNNLQISNEYDKLFLGDWFPSDSHVVKSSGMDFSSSSSSLPLSPFSLPSNTNSNSFSGPCGFKSDVAGERGGGDDEDASMKTMGVNNGEVQFNGSQAVSVTDLEKMVESGKEKNRGESSSRESKKLKQSSGKKPEQEGSSSGTKKPAKGAAKKNQRLGPKITALQRLISPYGKTDAASVLNETANNIRYLHEQIKILAAPYMGTHHQRALANLSGDLHSRGLCLVPVTPELVNLTSQLSSNRSVPGNALPYSRFRV